MLQGEKRGVKLGATVQIGVAGTLGALAYLALVQRFRVPEAAFVMDAVLKKLRRR